MRDEGGDAKVRAEDEDEEVDNPKINIIRVQHISDFLRFLQLCKQQKPHAIPIKTQQK